MDNKKLSVADLEKVVGGISAQVLFDIPTREEAILYLRKNYIYQNTEAFDRLMSLWERAHSA